MQKVRTYFFNHKNHIPSRLAAAILIVALSFPFFKTTNTAAQSTIPFIHQVRSIEADEIGLAHPAGLTFSNRGHTFQVVDAVQMAFKDTDLVQLTDLEERAGSVRLAASVQNPVNITFDNKLNRLLFISGQADQLVTMHAAGDGRLNPAGLGRYDVKAFGLHEPQGLAIDEKTGMLFILDAAGPRIVRVAPAPDGSFNGANIMGIDLGTHGFSSVRGIAYNPSSGNLFVIDPIEKKLYELSQSGQLATTWDLAQFNLKNPQAIVFAPSGDQTDDPAQMSLYMADSGFIEGKNQITDSQNTGQIIEFSLDALAEPAAASFTASLVRTTNMAAISPPSPDPSGIAFLPNSNTLMVVDGEVDETISGVTHFQGANVWELTLLGSKVRTANISKRSPTVTPMTNEPTDVAWNPTNGHFYTTDDNDKRVYDLNPGGDGLVGTADDTWTYFSTLSAGNGDPEGLTINPWNNHIFVADGVDVEVYEYTISGDLVNHFDVKQYGVIDPEGIEFNTETGTLFTLSHRDASPVIVETTTTGVLLQTINVSAANPVAVAGLAYGPASDGSGAKRFYIVDRGIDNNDDPDIIDGKMYEVTAPPPSVQTPTFEDVPLDHMFWRYIEAFYQAGITTGCSQSPKMFCPDANVTRGEMAVFIERAMGNFNPNPNPTGMFADVPYPGQPAFFQAYIEEFYNDGITSGCAQSPLRYCPQNNVTRQEMAVFIERALGNFSPNPNPSGNFADVPAPGAPGIFTAFIDQFYNDGITTGCAENPLRYCPLNNVTRQEMAVFIVRAFNIPLP